MGAITKSHRPKLGTDVLDQVIRQDYMDRTENLNTPVLYNRIDLTLSLPKGRKEH